MPEFTSYIRPIRPRFEPAGRFIRIGQERIHIVEQGTGYPVLLIHGLLGNTSTWRFVAPALAARYRVISIDLVGFGHSTRRFRAPLSLAGHAARVVGVLDALDIARSAVVGHSLGGAIAQHVAATHPDRISHLGLIASLHAGDSPVWGNAARRAEAAARYASFGLRLPPAVRFATARALRQLATVPGSVDRIQVLNYSEPLFRSGTLTAFRALFETVDRESAADVRRIAAPTLVVSGGRDSSIPIATGARLAGDIGGARHVVIHEAGHLCAEEHSEEITALLHEFLEVPGERPKDVR